MAYTYVMYTDLIYQLYCLRAIIYYLLPAGSVQKLDRFWCRTRQVLVQDQAGFGAGLDRFWCRTRQVLVQD